MRHSSLLLAFLLVAAAAAAGEWVFSYSPHDGVRAHLSGSKAFTHAPALETTLATPNIVYQIAYHDPPDTGFLHPADGPARRARLEEALTYVAAVLNMQGELDVYVDASEYTAGGFLARAGSYYGATPGLTNGSAHDRLSTGTKPFANFPEIEVRVNFGRNFHFGTRPPAASQIDFLSTMVHELGHGFGFISLMDAQGGSVIAPGVYSVFDGLVLRRNSGVYLVDGDPPAFAAAPADLVSGNLAFNGPEAFLRYAQPAAPGIYAPNPFAPGGSLSHWDTGNIAGGAVMENLIASGVERRRFEPVDLGALVDIGYASAAQAAAAWCVVNTTARVTVTDATNGLPVANAIVTRAPAPLAQTQNANGVYSVTLPEALVYTLAASAPGYANAATSAEGACGIATVDRALALQPAPAPQLETVPGPDPHDFGSLEIGSSESAAFTVRNAGGGQVQGAATLTGAPEFTLTGGGDYLLGMDAEKTVTVTFTPGAAGAFNAALLFTNSNGDDISIALAGQGAAPPAPEACGCGATRSGGPGSNAAAALVALATALALAARTRKLQVKPVSH